METLKLVVHALPIRSLTPHRQRILSTSECLLLCYFLLGLQLSEDVLTEGAGRELMASWYPGHFLPSGTDGAAILMAQQLGILAQRGFQHGWGGFPGPAGVGLAQQSGCFCAPLQEVLESEDAVRQVRKACGI